jgi:hypothetical protein
MSFFIIFWSYKLRERAAAAFGALRRPVSELNGGRRFFLEFGFDPLGID